MKKKFISLELNEVKFDYVEKYIELGYLPNFKKLFKKYNYLETISENKYEELEPWIQWVTVHTGLTYNEHKIFRLGQGSTTNHEQIWENLETKGCSVAAVSPMNAANKLSKSKCFIPDPWTQTKCTGNFLTHSLYRALCQAVNDNAKNKITITSLLSLFMGLLYTLNLKSIKDYVIFLKQLKKKKWTKALILDRLLTDIFIKMWRKHTPDYATLFLNSAAHIQHHYMYSSKVYDGSIRNPEWYISKDKDPVLEVYELYDRILGQFIELKKEHNCRLSVVTALGQKPYPKNSYYYRLRDHESFLQKNDILYQSLEPQMSRDFTVFFSNEAQCLKAETRLNGITDMNGQKIFYVDNNGDRLFAMLIYPDEITSDFSYLSEGKVCSGFFDDVAFVAIKNSEHDTKAYYLDTGINTENYPDQIPLTTLFDFTIQHFRHN